MKDCQKYIEKMNAYLDGALPAFEISELLGHMERCPSCRARFESLKIISFEMRHFVRETPPGLHDAIMERVKTGKKPSKRAYTRIFATIAAAAALTIFAVNGDFFKLSRVYLFGTETEVAGEAAKTPRIETQPKEEPKTTHDPLAIIPQSPLQSKIKPPETENTPAEASNVPATQPQPNTAPNIVQSPSNAPAPSTNDNPKLVMGVKPPTLPSTDPSLNTQIEASGELPAPSMHKNLDPAQPFRVPKLATDEEFGFYCIAVGNNDVPESFPKETVIKGIANSPTYIYIDNSAEARKDAEAVLQKCGFTIMRAPTNLPDIAEGSDYGLIVLFKQ